MTKEERQKELTYLNAQWQKETRKIKKYQFLLNAAQKRRDEIEKKIFEL